MIVEYNGQKVENAADLIGKVSATAPDETVNLVFMRETGAKLERKTTAIKLSERPSNNKVVDDESSRRPLGGNKEIPKPFGLTLLELTPALISTYKIIVNKSTIPVGSSKRVEKIVRGRLANGNPIEEPKQGATEAAP